MVGPASSGIPRAPDYSGLSVYGSLQLFAYGTFTLFGLLSQHCSTKLMVCNYRIYLRIYLLQPLYPLSATSADYLTENVWANPLSLTTTQGISSISLPPDTEMFHFSGFLHTSVQCLDYSRRVAPFGYLRIFSCLRLPAVFRSLPRPSSAVSAKASTVCPYYLNLTLLVSASFLYYSVKVH